MLVGNLLPLVLRRVVLRRVVLRRVVLRLAVGLRGCEHGFLGGFLGGLLCSRYLFFLSPAALATIHDG